MSVELTEGEIMAKKFISNLKSMRKDKEWWAGVDIKEHMRIESQLTPECYHRFICTSGYDLIWNIEKKSAELNAQIVKPVADLLQHEKGGKQKTIGGMKR